MTFKVDNIYVKVVTMERLDFSGAHYSIDPPQFELISLLSGDPKPNGDPTDLEYHLEYPVSTTVAERGYFSVSSTTLSVDNTFMTATDVPADSHVILKTVSGASYAQTETVVTLSTNF